MLDAIIEIIRYKNVTKRVTHHTRRRNLNAIFLSFRLIFLYIRCVYSTLLQINMIESQGCARLKREIHNTWRDSTRKDVTVVWHVSKWNLVSPLNRSNDVHLCVDGLSYLTACKSRPVYTCTNKRIGRFGLIAVCEAMNKKIDKVSRNRSMFNIPWYPCIFE